MMCWRLFFEVVWLLGRLGDVFVVSDLVCVFFVGMFG